MKYKLYKRGNALYLDVNIDGERKRVALGLSVSCKVSSNNLLFGRTKEAFEANAQLMSLYRRLEKAADIEQAEQIIKNRDVKPTDDIFLSDWIGELVTGLEDGSRTMNGKVLRQGTVKMYKAMLSSYTSYVGRKDIKVFENDTFKPELTQSEKREIVSRLNKHFKGWQQSMDVQPSTQRHYISKMKAVLNEIERTEGVRLPMNVSVEVTKLPVFSWPTGFTSQFLEHRFTDPIANVMKLQILTCMRPGDILNLRKENFRIELSSGKRVYFVDGITEKNNTVVKPIIPEELWRVCKEMCNPFLVKGYAKRSKYENYYKGIKAVLENFEQVEVDTYEYTGDQVTRKNLTLQQATTPHILRKAGINWYKSQGVDDSTIMKNFSGHSSLSVYNRHYVGEQQMDAAKLAQGIVVV